MWKLVDQDATLTAIGVPERYPRQVVPVVLDVRHAAHHRCRLERAKVDLAAAKAELKGLGLQRRAGDHPRGRGLDQPDRLARAGAEHEGCRLRRRAAAARLADGAGARAKKDGWSMFPVYSNGTDMYSPLTHFYVAATCNDFPGWSCDNRVPELMKAFTRAATLEERKKIAADIQTSAYEMVPSVMWGQFTIPAGYRTDLKGPDPVVLSHVLGGRPLTRQELRMSSSVVAA
jgi:peptide/nickel transport system substrate-binding protein